MSAYIIAGTGPPVVLISQLGCGADIWKPVLERLDGLRVVTYDRPSTGIAPPRPAPNPPVSYGAFANELADLLDQHGITEPAIIVGHSIGGLIARAYASAHPERTGGLVIADGSIPPLHLQPSVEPKRDGDGPDATEIDVVRGHVEILEATLPRVPALVLTRTHGTWNGGTNNVPPHPAAEDLWRVSQRILARALDCPLLVADNAGHQMPRDAPALVAYAIRAVHDAVRGDGAVQIDAKTLPAASGHLDD